MADPTKYQRSFSFSGYQATNPTKPLPGPSVDNEYENIELSLNGAIDAIKDVRRSDGALKNQSVGPDQISPALSIGFTFEGVWTLGETYSTGDGVIHGDVFYSARVQNTATNANRPDVDPGTWTLLFSIGDIVVAGAVSTNVFTGVGDGVSTTFNIGFVAGSTSNLFVKVGGVLQDVSEYSVNGSQVTFFTAPPTGYGIEVRGFSTVSAESVHQDALDAAASAAAAQESEEAAADYAALARNNFVVDRFAGNGVTTVFTNILSVEPGSTNNTFVAINGVLQQKNTYSVTGRTVTFTEAPPGDGVAQTIEVSYGNQIPVGTPSDGTINAAKLMAGDAAAMRGVLSVYSISQVDTLLKGVKGADLASAATVDLGAATGDFVDITGNVTITSLGTAAAGVVRTVRFTGTPVITHNATSLILYSRTTLTAFNGLVMVFRSLGGGNWIEESQTQAIGTWTPGVAFGGASVGATYGGLNAGRYIKNGRKVSAWGCLNLSAKGSSVGLATITGLPFVIAAASPLGVVGAIGNFANLAGLTGMPLLLGNAGAATLNVAQSAAASSATLTDTAFTNTSRVSFSVEYETAS